jgi:hypothetical protein
LDWNKQIAMARSEAEVVRIVREYLSTLPGWLKTFVPATCHARPIRDGADVTAWSVLLAARFAGSESAVWDLEVMQLQRFFVRAASRLVELRGSAGVRPFRDDALPTASRVDPKELA